MENVVSSTHAQARPEALISSSAPVQYMGSYVPSPVHVNTACKFSALPPPAADFRLPLLRCSFPSLLHPQYELVKEQCDAWILGFVQPASPATHRLLLDCLLPRLLCRNIPTASTHRLIQVAKIISWLIIADDEDDLPDALGADVIATTESAALVMAIIRHHKAAPGSLGGAKDMSTCPMSPKKDDHQLSMELPRKPSISASKARALEALAQVWEEIHKEISPNLRARFISTMSDYFDAIKVQATYRTKHQIPDMEAYMEIRRQASFILAALSLVEYAIGIELDKDVYAHPQIKQFRNAVVDFICLCNDIVSCRTEIRVGDYFNMPSIVYNIFANKEECATFQAAINFVASMTEQLDAQIMSMVASIQQSEIPTLQCPFVKTYVAALGSCMSGCLAWFFETARYSNS